MICGPPTTNCSRASKMVPTWDTKSWMYLSSLPWYWASVAAIVWMLVPGIFGISRVSGLAMEKSICLVVEQPTLRPPHAAVNVVFLFLDNFPEGRELQYWRDSLERPCALLIPFPIGRRWHEVTDEGLRISWGDKKKRRSGSDLEHVVHAVAARRAPPQALGGAQRAAGEDVAGAGAMGEFQALALAGEDHGVFAHYF